MLGAKRDPVVSSYVQQDQPEGVPPLELTGERTLPDVPEENYWYRRHLAVYEWIADRVEGERVIDLACGEGYGSDVLARRAAEVVGVDANPEAHEHASLRYRRPNLRFERDLVENVAGPADAVVFLQTIEHIEDAPALLAAIGRAAPLAYVSTPNRLTLAPEGGLLPQGLSERRSAQTTNTYENQLAREGKKGWSGFLSTDDRWQDGYVSGRKGAMSRYFAGG